MKKKNTTITLDPDVEIIAKEYDINLSKLLNVVIRAGFSSEYRRKNARVGRRRKVIPHYVINEGLSRGYTQRQIAERLNVSVSTINRRIKEFS